MADKKQYNLMPAAEKERKNKILYLTYDGLTDQLGQSQILPYLEGLSGRGYDITVLSCEKKETFSRAHFNIRQKLSDKKIKWEYFFYYKNPPVISALRNILVLQKKAFRLHRKNRFSIVHCRSYITSLAGLAMKKKFNTKFIFDMRGFWADERVDGGLWNLRNPLYKLIYHYFKKKEIEFLSNADYTISLTQKAKELIHSSKKISNQPIPIHVIPCCVDLEHFSEKNVTEQLQNRFKQKHKINKDDFVISYLGAIGTWYLLDEMLLFFKELIKEKPSAKFLFITNEQPAHISRAAFRLGVSPHTIIVQKASRDEVPALLSLSNVSVFFIKPCFSKKASSPTKMGEIMAMGIPVICNKNIGDVEQIVHQANSGILLNDFNEMEFKTAIARLDELLAKDKKQLRKGARDFFSLEKGIACYENVYTALNK